MNTNLTLVLKERENKEDVAKNLDVISIDFDPLSPIVDVIEKMDETDYKMRRKIEMPENDDEIPKYGNLIPDIIKRHLFLRNVWRNEYITMIASKELLDSTVDSNIDNTDNSFIYRKDIRISKTLYIDFIMYTECSSIPFNLSSLIFDKEFGKIIHNYISIKDLKIEWVDLNLIYTEMIRIINSDAICGKLEYGYDGVVYYDRTVRHLPNSICCSTKLPRKYYTIKSKHYKNGLASFYIHHEGGLLRKLFR